jgi:MFS family permease
VRRPSRNPTLEEGEDALLEGDQPYARGTARAALAVRDFRVVWFGSFLSNIGTWMQNVTLGAFAYELTRSPSFVSLIVFAQLGPMLLLSVVGGLLADTVDRRRIIVTAQTGQLLGSLTLAGIVAGGHRDGARRTHPRRPSGPHGTPGLAPPRRRVRGGEAQPARRADPPRPRHVLVPVPALHRKMPTVAAVNLGMDTESLAYGLLYASFGVGAVTGAMSIGTFLSGRRKEDVVRFGFAGFSVTLLAFALLRDPAPAYPVVALVGFTYFGAMTALNTVLQSHLPEGVRGRVMSLWLMGFGGTVPLGLLFAGLIAEVTSITVVLLYGAAMGFVLFVVADLDGARARGAAKLAAITPANPIS